MSKKQFCNLSIDSNESIKNDININGAASMSVFNQAFGQVMTQVSERLSNTLSAINGVCTEDIEKYEDDAGELYARITTIKNLVGYDKLQEAQEEEKND